MKNTVLSLVVMIAACCSSLTAATYYVSNTGTDSPSCTSTGNPCKTLAYVNSSITLIAGDNVLLQRGGVWNEPLVPGSSGASGNPITYDAYGTGAAPVLTAAAAITGGFNASSWTFVSGGAWSAVISTGVTSPTLDGLQFGTIWGNVKTGTCASVVTAKYDYCVSGTTVYVYSPAGTNPVSYYATEGSITPYAGTVAGLALINISSRTNLVFQHIKIVGFGYMGVSVTGTSDNLTFANMESDGMIPVGATPHGFWISSAGSHIQLINVDAHMNYDGFHINAATSVTMTNCRAYANRNSGLNDSTAATPSPITYSYSHFYGNNAAQLIPADIVWHANSPGPTAGAGNLGVTLFLASTPTTSGVSYSTVAPVVNNFATYPARFSYTVDDVGLSPGTETYINSIVPYFASRNLHLNAAVVPSYSVDWTSVQAWATAGHEIDAHSWSHQYYVTSNVHPSGTCTPASCPPAPAFRIQYTGSGTAATMTVSGTVATFTVTGAPSDTFSVDLSQAPYNVMGQAAAPASGLAQYMTTRPNFTVYVASDGCPTAPCVANAALVRSNTHTKSLAGTTGSSTTISGQDVKTAPFVWTYDPALLVNDEMSQSKAALQSQGFNPTVYVYPDARNTARQDSELEATKARVMRLEQVATTNTEARIRTEVQLGELRDGQNEIKAMIQAHDSASRKVSPRK
jgi:hypothetical protein